VIETRPVQPRPFRRTRSLWVAFLAAALNALWPVAAYAPPASHALPLQLCTAQAPGATPVPPPVAPHGKGTHLQHCAFCFASGAKFLAPPAVPGSLPAATAPTHPRPVSSAIPRPHVSPYLPAHPRGPPGSLPA
jgi:hypothetical protein